MDSLNKNNLIFAIDTADTSTKVLNTMSLALKAWIDDIITQKQYSYIKGYADCKIKQLNNNI